MGDGDVVLSVASAGIACCYLAHQRENFSFPIQALPTNHRYYHLKNWYGSFDANIIRQAKLVVWDEAAMTPKFALNAVDALFRSVLKKPDVPFGGMVMLLGGDFRQCLPIVPHGRRVDVIESTIQMCPTWSSFQILRLTKNMRTATDSQEYADWLRKLGDGELTSNCSNADLGPDVIEIPEDFILPPGQSLISHVFGENGEMLLPENEQELCCRAILCPKNEDCRDINYHIVTELMPGREMHTYNSINSVDCQDPAEAANFPTEFLNSLEMSGLPQHCLR